MQSAKYNMQNGRPGSVSLLILHFVFCILYFAFLTPVSAAEPADLFGDALPRGARARLGTVRWRHDGWVTSLAFSPDGKTVATGGGDNLVRLWDVANRQPTRQLSPGSKVQAVAFSPDGKVLATGSWDQTVRVWDVATGKLLHTLSGFSSEVIRVAFSPDGTVIAATARGRNGASGEKARFWNVATGEPLHKLDQDGPDVLALAFSPDHKTITTTSNDATVRSWDAATGKKLRDRVVYYDISTVIYSPDGTMLATGQADYRTAGLWQADASSAPLRKCSGHQGLILTVAFSPDNKTLLTGSLDKTIRLWDVATGKQVALWAGHVDTVSAVAFAPDGKTAASTSWDKTIRLWDVASGTEIGLLAAHGARSGPPPRRRTASWWRQAETTAPCASGTPPPAGRYANSMATPTRSYPWRSPPTATPSPRAARITPCDCGTWSRDRQRPC
jgi:WD40 repeat protein